MSTSAERYIRLSTILAQMARYNSVTRKFAEVLNGQTQFALLGYPEKETASLFGINARAKILLKRSYILHMDNSGHFTGSGFGKRGHNDPNPLTLSQISDIPAIIKTARQDEIKFNKQVRGLKRYKITRRASKNNVIVVEVSIEKNEITLVTAYNLVKRRRTHNRMRLLSHG